MLGSKEIWSSFNNPRLSSGNLLFSGNALPVPQLRVGIFDYADFWGTKGWFAVKGYISYGMFTDGRWQKSWPADTPKSKRAENVLFHSKGLWLRGGNPSKFPLVGEVGIEMATQFGGKAYKNGESLSLGSSLKHWVRAFFPTSTTLDTFLCETPRFRWDLGREFPLAFSLVPNGRLENKSIFRALFRRPVADDFRIWLERWSVGHRGSAAQESFRDDICV